MCITRIAMDPWDPQLVRAVAHQLDMAEAPRTPLRAFLEMFHHFAATSAYAREKPVAECITALQDILAKHPTIPRAVRGCLGMSAPPNEALSAAVTVASALYAGEITEALLARAQREFRADAPALRSSATAPPTSPASEKEDEGVKTYLNVYSISRDGPHSAQR